MRVDAGGTGRMGRMGRRRIVHGLALFLMISLPALPALPALHAQHAAFRVKGRVTNDRGAPIPNADVRLEAFFGYAAGTFSGPRLLSAQTNAKGEWNVGALQPGIWLFEVFAPNYMPESVALPIRILTTVSMGTSGWRCDFDSASRAFDATRNRTHDKDEQKFLSAAIGDLATIKFR